MFLINIPKLYFLQCLRLQINSFLSAKNYNGVATASRGYGHDEVV